MVLRRVLRATANIENRIIRRNYNGNLGKDPISNTEKAEEKVEKKNDEKDKEVNKEENKEVSKESEKKEIVESPEEIKKREKKEKLKKILEHKKAKEDKNSFHVSKKIKYSAKEKVSFFYSNDSSSSKFKIENSENTNQLHQMKLKLENNKGEISIKNHHLIQYVFNHTILIVNHNSTFFEISFPVNINLTYLQLLNKLASVLNISNDIVILIVDGKKLEKSSLSNIIGHNYSPNMKFSLVICGEIVAFYNLQRRGLNNNVRNKTIYDKMEINNYVVTNENVNIYSIYLPKESLQYLKIIEIDINPNDLINKKLKKSDNDDDTAFKNGYYLAEVYDFESLSNNWAEIEKQNIIKTIFERSNIKWRDEYEKNKNTQYTEGSDFLRIMTKQTNTEVINSVDSTFNSKDCITLMQNKVYLFKFNFLNTGSCNCLTADRHKVSFYFDCGQKELAEDIDNVRPFMHICCNKNNKLIAIRGFELRKNTPFLHKYTKLFIQNQTNKVLINDNVVNIKKDNDAPIDIGGSTILAPNSGIENTSAIPIKIPEDDNVEKTSIPLSLETKEN